MKTKMNESYNLKSKNALSIREIFISLDLLNWKLWIINFLILIVAIFYVKKMPDIYKSEATLITASSNSSLNLSNKLGGLAAFAGVEIGGSNNDKTILAIEKIKSRSFLTRFTEKNDIYIELFAVNNWDRKLNLLLVDKDVYDENLKVWTRNVTYPHTKKPSKLEAVEKLRKIINITIDKTTGVITISVEHYSPIVAAKWLNLLIEQLNYEVALEDKLEAEKSIEYLNRQLKESKLLEVRNNINILLEEQNKKLMLSNIRDNYILKYIDPPIEPEVKDKPKRTIIILFIMAISLILSLGINIIRNTK